MELERLRGCQPPEDVLLEWMQSRRCVQHLALPACSLGPHRAVPTAFHMALHALASRRSDKVAALSQKELGRPCSSPVPVAAAAQFERLRLCRELWRASSRPRTHALHPRSACSLCTTTSGAHREVAALSATLEQARAPGVSRRLAQVRALPRGRLGCAGVQGAHATTRGRAAEQDGEPSRWPGAPAGRSGAAAGPPGLQTLCPSGARHLCRSCLAAGTRGTSTRSPRQCRAVRGRRSCNTRCGLGACRAKRAASYTGSLASPLERDESRGLVLATAAMAGAVLLPIWLPGVARSVRVALLGSPSQRPARVHCSALPRTRGCLWPALAYPHLARYARCLLGSGSEDGSAKLVHSPTPLGFVAAWLPFSAALPPFACTRTMGTLTTHLSPHLPPS